MNIIFACADWFEWKVGMCKRMSVGRNRMVKSVSQSLGCPPGGTGVNSVSCRYISFGFIIVGFIVHTSVQTLRGIRHRLMAWPPKWEKCQACGYIIADGLTGMGNTWPAVHEIVLTLPCLPFISLPITDRVCQMSSRWMKTVVLCHSAPHTA